MSAVDDFTGGDLAQFLGMDSSWGTPRTSSTVASDLLGQGQGVSNGGSSWGSWLQGLGTTLVGYSLAKDRMDSQAATAQQIQQARLNASNVPLYSNTGGGLALSPIVLIAGAVVLVMVLKDK